MNILLIALCGALLFFLVFWIIFAIACFSKAYAESKEEVAPIQEYDPPASNIELALISYSVDHLRWKRKRGYLWGGGYRYD